MTDVDAEIELLRAVRFIDLLGERGLLTSAETRTALTVVADRSAAVVGPLVVRARLDKTGV